MASGEVATVSIAQLSGGAAARLRRHDQRPDLGRHRTRRLSVTYPFPVKDLVVLDDALKYRLASGQGPVRGLPWRSRRQHRRKGPRDPGQGADAG